MEKLQQSLLLTHLKYQTYPQNLKIIAFKQLAEKVLIHSGNSLKSSDEIAKLIAATLGLKRLDKKHVDEALAELGDEKRVELISGKWKLADNVKEEINNEIIYFDTELNHILEKYFSIAGIGKASKKKWFSDACSHIFSVFGDIITDSIIKPNSSNIASLDIETNLLPIIEELGLQSYGSLLIDGFRNFLRSEDIRERDFIHNMAMAMVATKLVSANIGVDPLGLKILKGSTLIADTNILINMATEKGIDHQAMMALLEAFNDLEIKMVYLPSTQVEYMRVINAAIENTLPLFNKYSLRVLEEVNDDLLLSAIDSGAVDYATAEEYFNNLLNFPPIFETFTVSKLQDEVTESAIDGAATDIRLIKRIRELSDNRDALRYLKNHNVPPKPRSEASIIHDVALIKAAEAIRKVDGTYMILTADGIVKKYNSKIEAGKLPLIMSFATLVDVLAIYNGGHNVHGSKFAPLLAKIILNRCLPSRDAYSVQDLRAIADASDKAAVMSPDEIKQVVRDVKLHELGGTSKNKIAVAIERALSNKSTDENTRLKSLIQDHARATSESEKKLDKLRIAQVAQKLRFKNYISLAKWTALTIVLFLAILGAAYFTIIAIVDSPAKTLVIGLLVDVIAAFRLIPEIIGKYCEEKKSNAKKVNNEIDQFIEG